MSWKTGLCDFCGEPGGAGLCLKAYFCVPCVFGETVAMLSPGEHPCAGNCVGGGLALYVPVFNIYATCAARAAIRKKYNINGGCVDDLLCGCSLCGLIQV